MNFLVGKSSDKSSGWNFPCTKHTCRFSTGNATPVKILSRWKMLQIYDIFPLLLAKTRKNFYPLMPSNFFFCSSWKVTNGFAFVSVEGLVKNDLQCFSRFFFSRMRKLRNSFLAQWKLQNLIGKYFLAIEKQFFNQTQKSLSAEK